jgi:hypothetical protein
MCFAQTNQKAKNPGSTMARISMIAATAAVSVFLALGRAEAHSNSASQNPSSHHQTSHIKAHHGNSADSSERHLGSGTSASSDAWHTIHPIPYLAKLPRLPVRSPVSLKQPTKSVPPVYGKVRNLGKVYGQLLSSSNSQSSGGLTGLAESAYHYVVNAVKSKVSIYVNGAEMLASSVVNTVETIGSDVETIGSDIESWF